MINRRFTFRENVLLIVVSMLLTAIFSYLTVRKPAYAKAMSMEREQLAVEDELEIQRHMAERKDSMNLEMKQEQGKENGILGSYNNLTCEIEELGQILAGARAYELSFSKEELSEDIVRRDIFISYQTDSYGQAQEILAAIENGTYCCVVKEVDLVRKEEGTKEEDGETIYGSLLVTYYEKMDEENQAMGQRDWEDDTSGGDDWR